jgi:hypothetical protein
MYEGTIEIKRAAKSPASGLLVASFVKKYVEIEQKPAKTGAKKTQMFLISIGRKKASRLHLTEAAVPMIPGKIVPPTVRPSGYQDSESNQFQREYQPSLTKNLVVL